MCNDCCHKRQGRGKEREAKKRKKGEGRGGKRKKEEKGFEGEEIVDVDCRDVL